MNMNKQVTLVDYGMGNLRSVSKALERLGASVLTTSSPEDITKAERLVLPGVGAMADAMVNLEKNNLIGALREYAAGQKPFLGICLGLQALFDASEENGRSPGLGILPGEVRFLAAAKKANLKVPHMGWNQVTFRPGCPLFKDIADGAHLYFVHSYYPAPKNEATAAAWTEYGERFCCAVQRNALFAVQFHPEKSQAIGLKILENFLKV